MFYWPQHDLNLLFSNEILAYRLFLSKNLVYLTLARFIKKRGALDQLLILLIPYIGKNLFVQYWCHSQMFDVSKLGGASIAWLSRAFQLQYNNFIQYFILILLTYWSTELTYFLYITYKILQAVGTYSWH